MENKLIYKSNLSIKSDVENNLILSCFFNNLSSDHIGQLNFNARAKYSISFESGEIFFALFKKLLNSSVLNSLILGLSKKKKESISSLDNPDFLHISSLCLSNSFNIN